MKKLICLSLAVLMSLSIFMVGNAEVNTIVIETPSEKIEILKNNQLSERLEAEKRAAPEYDYKHVNVGTEVAHRQYIGEAGGQLPGGTVFETNKTAGFYWQDGGYEVPITVSVSYGPFSLSVSPGSTGGSTGKFIGAPTNVPCKLHIYKDIEVNKVEIYRKRSFTSSDWQYYKTEYIPLPTREYLTVKTL